MRRPSSHVTLRRLMALVALLGVVLALLRHAVRSWGPGEVATGALIVLLATNVLAWFQGARWQVFWVGFGIFGWAYLTLSLESPAGEHLPTTWLLDGLHDRLYPDPAPSTLGDAFDEAVAGPGHADRFRRAGQSVLSLAFALLGGIMARLMVPARRDDPGGARPPDGSLLEPGWREKSGDRPREVR